MPSERMVEPFSSPRPARPNIFPNILAGVFYLDKAFFGRKS
jgi:hypothetical protein